MFRLFGFIILALALVLAVLDITRSITASALVLTPLADAWMTFNPQTFEAAKEVVTNMLPLFVWDTVIGFVLALPSWLIFWVLAMVLLWLGQKRDNKFGRFASR